MEIVSVDQDSQHQYKFGRQSLTVVLFIVTGNVYDQAFGRQPFLFSTVSVDSTDRRIG